MGSLKEGCEVRFIPRESLDQEFAKLDSPWIAEEGPLDVAVMRGPEKRPGKFRGMAFDAETTLYWDEEAVQLVRRTAVEPGTLAYDNPVLVREGFSAVWDLRRIDYLSDGVLIASRYVGKSAQPDPAEEDKNA